MSWYLAFRKRKEEKKLKPLRAPYIPGLRNIICADTSIISSNCFAGRILQDLGLQYNTPTLGLYFFADDYIEFLSHLRHYLTEARLEFADESKYELGNERRAKWSHWYPIGILGGKVEIHFLHYHTEKDAAEKWCRRAKRVNFDKLMIIGMEQNLTEENHIKAFDKLPFRNKIFFSTKQIADCKSNCFVKEYSGQGEIGNAYRDAHIFYEALVNRFYEDSLD